ncbi:ABC transporter permease [Leptolyngbya sp. FACHB-261]|uniref:ABC transporter permease n=1 Tax=Leptolyngbya sp. FACHB-261 TaxID=2692806 RepID=UPI00168779A4|nr:ABC transporter permease [Leptolyngbya sp. FACHB-261]MBD2099677.1 ABC transporter permease [Leptolyngbya sp. FACHB-261]
MTSPDTTVSRSPWARGSRVLSGQTTAYVVKRLLQAVLTLWLVSLLSFFMIQLAPGNYLDTLKLEPTIDPQTIEQLTQQFGLDKPIWEQYTRWLWQALHGNLGTSFSYRIPAATLIGQRVLNTLLLAISSIIVTWGVAIPLGIFCAVNQNRWIDRTIQLLSYTLQGFPSFIAALLFLVIAQNTPLFPVGGMTSISFAELSPLGKVLDIAWHMILPTLALSVTSFAGLQRLTRGNLLDVLRQNYIQTARAKGLSENRVIYFHALRNAINPLVTLLGFEFASLLSGAFIAETLFNWPGLGKLILQAVQQKDLYVVMASLLIGAAMLVIGNLLADLLLKAVDPRISLDKLD